MEYHETGLYAALLLYLIYLVYANISSLCFVILAYLGNRLYVNVNKSYVDIGRKAVLITGCDTGFGHELAKSLSIDGYVVFAGVLHVDGHGAKHLRSLGNKSLHVIKLDVTLDDDVKEALHEVKTKAKKTGLWGIVNNAGFNIFGDVEHASIEQYKKCAEVNLYGAIRVIRAFLPMIRESRGRVVNVTSVLGLYSMPGWSVYHTTKHALETLSDSLRLEMTPFGVKVAIVEPGRYDAATSCRSAERASFLRSEIDDQWEKADDEVRQTYGKDYFYRQVNVDLLANSARSPDPVVDAMKDALMNKTPKTRYLVPGGDSLVDVATELGRFHCVIPTFIKDKIILWRAGYCNQWKRKQ